MSGWGAPADISFTFSMAKQCLTTDASLKQENENCEHCAIRRKGENNNNNNS